MVFESDGSRYFVARQKPMCVVAIHREDVYPVDERIVLVASVDRFDPASDDEEGTEMTVGEAPPAWVIRRNGSMRTLGERVVTTTSFENGDRVCIRIMGGGKFPDDLDVEVLGHVSTYRE